MAETASTIVPEIIRRNLRVVAGITGLLAIAGCGDVRQARQHTIGNPAARIEFDYAGHAQTDNIKNPLWGQDCLTGTPYDITPPGNGSEHLVHPALLKMERTNDGQRVAVIVPPRKEYPKAPELKLVGFGDEASYLQPKDSESGTIMKQYGCDPGSTNYRNDPFQ